MALVAFDLDNTLGYFSHVGIWADMFSIDTLENSFNLALNPRFQISSALKEKLQHAEKTYMDEILNSPRILESVLRPNLDMMINPLIMGKKQGKIRAICIYSNTWNTFTVHLGKFLIEKLFKCDNLFDCVVDASHPIRAFDWSTRKQGDQIKTFKVLKSIFKELCGVKGSILPHHVLFVDERADKHQIADAEKDGLVYLKPTEFLPKNSVALLDDIYRMGIRVLKNSCLYYNKEYNNSDIVHSIKFGDWGKENEFIPVFSMHELLAILKNNLYKTRLRGHKFKDDSVNIADVYITFFGRF
jgi:hypothetical protein